MCVSFPSPPAPQQNAVILEKYEDGFQLSFFAFLLLSSKYLFLVVQHLNFPVGNTLNTKVGKFCMLLSISE